MKFKEILEIAKSQLMDMSPLGNPDFRLEQAEYIENEEIWDVIVSYLVPNSNKKSSPFAAITAEFEFFRIYKRLKIDKEKNIIGFFMYEKE